MKRYIILLYIIVYAGTVSATDPIRTDMLDKLLDDFKSSGSNARPAWLKHKSQGISFIGQGKFKEAIVVFDKSLTLKPDMADSYFYKGIAEHRLNYFILSDKSLNKAIKLSKPNAGWFLASAYALKGMHLVARKQYDIATMVFSKSLSLSKTAVAYEGRGIAYYSQKKFRKSLKDLDAAIKLNPQSPIAWDYKAGAHQMLYRLYKGTKWDKTDACQVAVKACQLGPLLH